MAAIATPYNKPVLPRTTDGSDLGSNRASIYSGKGLNFDGVNDWINLNSFVGLPKNNEAWSVAGYFKAVDNNARGTWFSAHNSNGGNIIRVGIEGGSTLGLFYADVYTADVQVSNINFQDSQWHFVVLSRPAGGNGTDLTVYLDGVAVATQGTGTNWDGATQFSLGQEYDGGSASDYWNGQMSDFKFFTTDLTAAQVAELYNNPEQSVPTGIDATSLVLHLPMTEGAGSYLYNANVNAIGTELISNAGFDETCQKWGTTDSSTVEIAGGKAIWTNAPLSGSFVEQPLDLEVGKFYRVKFDYTSTAFNIFVNLGDTQEAVPLGNGTYVYDMYYGSGSSSLKFKHGWTTNSSATVDNVSVKEVVPNYYNGTINGATWVRSLPEPLPQTALMDWNKGTNRVEDSEDLSQWIKNNTTVNSNVATDPYGFPTADEVINDSSTTSHRCYQNSGSYTGTNSVAFSVYLKYKNHRYVSFGATDDNIYRSQFVVDLVEGEITDENVISSTLVSSSLTDAGNGWYKLEGVITPTSSWVNNIYALLMLQNSSSWSGSGFTSSGTSVYVWGAQIELASEVGPYVPTFGTSQTNPILIQEGSTPGKDVFGNTISKPRASGAYNFDGSSYVQGLNTGYLPTGNEARSLELWVYHRSIPGATASQSLMEIGSGAGTNNRFGIMVTSPADALYMVGQGNDNSFAGFSIPENQWTHIVATHDGTTLNVYRNGSLAGTVSETYATIDVGYRIGLENRTTSTTSIIGSYEWTQSQIANPRIYNYALTAEQVADNFNEKASTFGGTKVASELDAYIERTASDGATVEAHSCLVNYLTELDKK